MWKGWPQSKEVATQSFPIGLSNKRKNKSKMTLFFRSPVRCGKRRQLSGSKNDSSCCMQCLSLSAHIDKRKTLHESDYSCRLKIDGEQSETESQGCLLCQLDYCQCQEGASCENTPWLDFLCGIQSKYLCWSWVRGNLITVKQQLVRKGELKCAKAELGAYCLFDWISVQWDMTCVKKTFQLIRNSFLGSLKRENWKKK